MRGNALDPFGQEVAGRRTAEIAQTKNADHAMDPWRHHINRFTNGDADARAYAAELVALAPDLILTSGGSTTDGRRLSCTVRQSRGDNSTPLDLRKEPVVVLIS